MLTIRVPGEIRGKGRPRFARRGSFVQTYSDTRTVSAENWVRSCAVDQVGQPVLEGPLTLSVVVTCTIPPSWTRKRQRDALTGVIRPIGRPDADNTLKLICDSLNKIIWLDDSQLVDVRMVKRYGNEPGALLTVSPA